VKQIGAYILIIGAVMMGLAACSSSDCPLNNVVLKKMNFYTTDGSSLTITDTLTITVRDSVILNHATDESTVSLPMSYAADTDTLVLHFTPKGSDYSATDTIIISKTNEPHFVSLECAKVINHTITDVKWSRRTPTATHRFAIDSIGVKNKVVNTDAKENLQIYFTVHK